MFTALITSFFFTLSIPIARSPNNDSFLQDESSPLLCDGVLKLTDVNEFDEKDENNQNNPGISVINGEAINNVAVPISTGTRRLTRISEENSELTATPNRPRKMTTLDQVPLFASLATGTTLEDSLSVMNLTPAEVNERLQEVGDLINRLEDTAALLRQHLHSAKHAFDAKAEEETESTSMKHIPRVLKYHLPIVAAVQLLCVTILSCYDHWLASTGKHFTILADTLMVILELIIVLEVVLATVELSRKLLKYGVPGSFLAQTYFSTVMAFAGVYFMIYRFDRKSWDIASSLTDEGAAFSEFIRMLYLSVSSATLCGAANIQPAAWYTIMLVCMQSLINFVYFASILAQTIGNYNSYTVHVQRSESLSRLSHSNSISAVNVS